MTGSLKGLRGWPAQGPFSKLGSRLPKSQKRPCGEEIVQLDSSEPQSPVDLNTENNRAHVLTEDRTSPAISCSEKKKTRETFKKVGATMKSASSSHWPASFLDGGQMMPLNLLKQSANNVGHCNMAHQSCPTVSLSDKKIVRKTIKRKCKTMSVTSLEDLQQQFGRCKYAAKSLGVSVSIVMRVYREHGMHWLSTVKHISRQHGWPFRLSTSSLHWPTGLPDGGQIMQLDSLEQSTNNVAHGARAHRSRPTVSLSDKKIVRKTMKRKCRTRGANGLEDLQQQFGSRPEDAAKSLGVSVSTVKRMCRHHGLHEWHFRQFQAKRKGCSLGKERSVEVISVSTDEKLVSRLRTLYIPQPTRSPPQPIALLDGGEVVNPKFLSVSGFPSTNNRAHIGREEQSGSTAPHSERKNTRETSQRKLTTRISFSKEELQQHFGSTREDAAKSLGVSVSTLKRICRDHGINRWPYGMKSNVWKPPDQQGGNNTSTACKTLSADGQTEMVNETFGDVQTLNEFRPTHEQTEMMNETFGGQQVDVELLNKSWPTDGWTEMLDETFGDVEPLNELQPGIVGGPNWMNSQNGSTEQIINKTHPAMELSIPSTSKEGVEPGGSFDLAFQLKESALSASYPNGSSILFAQPQIASAQMLNENVGSVEDWRNSFTSSAEAFFVGQVPHFTGNLFAPATEASREGQFSGSSNWTVPACSDTAPSLSTATIPLMMPTPPHVTPHLAGNFFAPVAEAAWVGQVSQSSNWTMPTHSDPAPSQPTTTIPNMMTTISHMMPHLTARQEDMRSATFKAKYRHSMIRFKLPVTCGIVELKEEVSKRVKLEVGSFNLEYMDDDQDWILIACDDDLREYLQLSSSLGSQVTRVVLDEDASASNFCESCGALKRK